MIRKIRLFICVILALSLFTGFMANAQTPIRVIVDGVTLRFDVPPDIIGGRTMVPMRIIFEALGAEVLWDQATQTITASTDGLVVKTTIWNKNIIVNGASRVMDVAPIIISGRTLVPVRFVSEAFGCDVKWDSATRVVNIDSSGEGKYTPPPTTPSGNIPLVTTGLPTIRTGEVHESGYKLPDPAQGASVTMTLIGLAGRHSVRFYTYVADQGARLKDAYEIVVKNETTGKILREEVNYTGFSWAHYYSGYTSLNPGDVISVTFKVSSNEKAIPQIKDAWILDVEYFTF